MKKYSLLLFSILLTSIAFAQNAVINFEVKSYDFGKISEEDGKATYVFNFTNSGNSPLVVNRVQASCGCTTPTWTKEPIEPGKKGTITVTYNPAGRPGVFTKSITVYSNASESQSGLIIKGEVVPKTTDVEMNLYPVSMGDIRLKTKVLQFNNVEKGKNLERTVEFKNTGNAVIKISVENLPAYLSAKVEPATINPKETGKITITFNSANCSQWGPVNLGTYIALNGNKRATEDFKLQVIANVVENFSGMTLEQKQKAPILETGEKTIDLGTIKTGLKKSAKIKIMNKGVNPLEIRRVINNNNELSFSPSKLTIHHAKTGYIAATLNSSKQTPGNYKKTITIQTNDPDNSFVLYVLTWKIEK